MLSNKVIIFSSKKQIQYSSISLTINYLLAYIIQYEILKISIQHQYIVKKISFMSK